MRQWLSVSESAAGCPGMLKCLRHPRDSSDRGRHADRNPNTAPSRPDPGVAEHLLATGEGRLVQVYRASNSSRSASSRPTVSCAPAVALVAGFKDFGNFTVDNGERVTLDQDAGEPTRRQAHHSVVPTVREQLCLNALHRTIQPRWMPTRSRGRTDLKAPVKAGSLLCKGGGTGSP